MKQAKQLSTATNKSPTWSYTTWCKRLHTKHQ